MFLKRISVRIGFWYAFAFLLSAAALYAFTAYFLIDSLRQKDEHLLRVKFDEYAALYARDGAPGLRTRSSALDIRDAQGFVVRLADAGGATLFLHVPDRSEDADALTFAEIEAALRKDEGRSPWFAVKARGFGDDVEVVSGRLPGGELLQIGKDTEDREDFIESFSSAFFVGLLPVLILALCTGVFLSNRLLRPIRALSQTMEKIRAGRSAARVPLHRADDELRRLGLLFNTLQEENERLINGMRETVNNVAHDLRTPITGMLNAIELAVSADRAAPDYKAALEDCYDSAESIRLLVEGVMDLAEAEAGTLPLRRENASIRTVIERATDLYGLVAEDKKIELVQSCEGDVRAEFDAVRMLQAVSNLIDNAIKYSPPGSKVFLTCGVQGARAVIAVQDQGPGIPEPDRAKIWDRLYRGDASRSTRGLGLGLSLVRAIALAHGGSAVCRPAPSGGTIFEVFLPLSPVRITSL